ncbi:DUF402 domain-containing protein [Natribacillus halophilus]|uniref:DUF402 domain-containing protein n=1 Tax=Natribacillus halophilus TaxID=549003 RepID=A0A1G8R665_9BACI|nr:DUF402 domain-containing protein [Natribacillus halophilus]SDJ12065.1 hypothetical protein SAMN04488123_11572 [Natribacillus halophilus]
MEIRSYKHNGKLHRLWETSTILQKTSTEIIGGNDRVLVQEASGERWRTREPAIFYFHRHKWFNTIALLREDGIYFYCNISSPCVIDSEVLKYIDYDLDIKVTPERRIQMLDEDEYEQNREEMQYPRAIEEKIAEGVNELKSWIDQGEGPFDPQFVAYWYEQFIRLDGK